MLAPLSADTANGGSSAAHAAADRLLRQAQGEAVAPTAGPAAARENAKIEKAGRDFESILLGSWLQGAEQSFAAAPGGNDDDEDGSRDQFMGMAMQQLAGTLAASGGIGIGRMIVSHLEAAQYSGTAPEEAKKVLPGAIYAKEKGDLAGKPGK